MLRQMTALAIVGLVVVASGCGRSRTTFAVAPDTSKTEAKSGGGGGGQMSEGGGGGVMAAGAARTRIINESNLRQLAMWVKQGELLENKVPKNTQELLGTMRDDPDLKVLCEPLEKGDLLFVQGLGRNLNGGVIIFYEKEPSKQWGTRLVAYGDGSVRRVEEADFQKAMKSKGQ